MAWKYRWIICIIKKIVLYLHRIKIMENETQNNKVAKATKTTEVSTTGNSLDRINSIFWILWKKPRRHNKPSS